MRVLITVYNYCGAQ